MMTDKQKKFCSEYLKDLNATQAAIRAGYSKDTAVSIGCENLTKPDIKDFIDKELYNVMEESRNHLKYRIIKELKDVAFANITEDINIITKTGLDKNGEVIEYQTVEINDTQNSTQATAIAGIKISDKGNIEIKYYDKLKAIDDLGKYLAMWTEKVEYSIDSEAFNQLKELYGHK